MVQYNPKDWLSFIFRFHKSDTFIKLLPMILVIGAYAGIIAFFEIEFWKWSDSNKVKNIVVMHSLLGFVISLLLVFRTNTAYDRWWEGRKLWGALVNNSRNLALKLSAILPKSDTQDRIFFKTVIPQYAVALKIICAASIQGLSWMKPPTPNWQHWIWKNMCPISLQLYCLKK